MKILLIGTRRTTEESEDYYEQYLTFFRRAITYSGNQHTIQHTLVDDLIIVVGDGEFTITDKKNNQSLKDYDLVLIRGHVRQHFDAVKAISIYLKLHNIPVINDYSSFRSSSKLIQAVQFFEIGIPVAKTVFVTPGVLADLSALPFDFPCIMKATYGSHGNDNFLVTSTEEIKSHAQEQPEREFVLQRFVPNDGDYRLLIVGKNLLIIKRFASAGSHLNNTSQGGKAELVDASTLPVEIVEQAHKITEHLGMAFAGVDVIYDANTKEYSFLEVNSQPQLMTGAFIEDKAKAVGQFLNDINPQ